ncbi:ABC transporter ATP-binding protein [Streptococcus pluranimalium]|uniref:ABC transporter ATP-binding protein n=1 Tax=Streptococcus pluranimalium TaxID=82348 RepID=UPI0039FDCCDA
MALLQLTNINKYYQLDGTNREQALKNISLSFQKGAITAIYGPSGCGKTSLLNIISGLDRDFEGELTFEGQSLRGLSEDDITLFRKNHIGFIFQNFDLIPHQTVEDNVRLPLYLQGLSQHESQQIVAKILDDLGILTLKTKNVKQLSGGQRQRVAIARALVNSPEIIVADEPTGALDSESQAMVLEILETLAKLGKTVIIVTHNPEVADYADVIITMKDGEVIHETNAK